MSDEQKIQDELEVVTPRTRSWIRGGFGCGLAAIIFVIWIAGITAISMYYKTSYHSDAFGIVPGIDQFTFSLILCLVAWILIDRKKIFREAGLTFPKSIVPWWLGGAIFGIMGVGAAILIIQIFGSTEIVVIPFSNYSWYYSGSWSWLQIIFILILYSGSEELFTRGLLYPLLHRYIGFVWSVLLSSLVFSLLHLENNAFGILPAIDIFFAGVLLALLREYTGTLWLAWGVHFGWNFGLAAAGLPVSGYIFMIESQAYRFVTGGPIYITGGDFGPEGGFSGIFANVVMVAVVIILIIHKKRKSALAS